MCRSCNRGQRYCCERCREKARRQQRREANRRHQRTEWGRLDHRDRQRAYRRRKAAAFFVTDQGSAAPSDVPTLGSWRASLWLRASGEEGEVPFESVVVEPVCCVCGRAGAFIDPWMR